MKYAIADISVLDFQLQMLPLPKDGDELKIESTHGFSVKSSENLVQLVLEFTFYINNKQVGKIKTGFVFHFEEITPEILAEDGTLRLEVRRQLFAVAVGTTRGIFHTKADGFPGGRLILPIVNPQEHVKE